MSTVKALLHQKGHEVETIGPDETVFEAIKRMEVLDIGSLVVTKGGKVVGLITERDYARNVFLKGKSSPKTHVREIMEENFMFVRPDQETRQCMAIMTSKRARHLPVMENGKLLGIISIGDIVKSIVAEQDLTIDQLEQYIHRG